MLNQKLNEINNNNIKPDDNNDNGNYEKEINNLRNNEIILKNKIANLENDAKQEKENNALTKKELIEIRSKYQTQLEEVEKLND